MRTGANTPGTEADAATARESRIRHAAAGAYHDHCNRGTLSAAG